MNNNKEKWRREEEEMGIDPPAPEAANAPDSPESKSLPMTHQSPEESKADLGAITSHHLECEVKVEPEKDDDPPVDGSPDVFIIVDEQDDEGGLDATDEQEVGTHPGNPNQPTSKTSEDPDEAFVAEELEDKDLTDMSDGESEQEFHHDDHSVAKHEDREPRVKRAKKSDGNVTKIPENRPPVQSAPTRKQKKKADHPQHSRGTSAGPNRGGSQKPITNFSTIPLILLLLSIYVHNLLGENSHLGPVNTHWRETQIPSAVINAFSESLVSRFDERHSTSTQGAGVQRRHPSTGVSAPSYADNDSRKDALRTPYPARSTKYASNAKIRSQKGALPTPNRFRATPSATHGSHNPQTGPFPTPLNSHATTPATHANSNPQTGALPTPYPSRANPSATHASYDPQTGAFLAPSYSHATPATHASYDPQAGAFITPSSSHATPSAAHARYDPQTGAFLTPASSHATTSAAHASYDPQRGGLPTPSTSHAPTSVSHIPYDPQRGALQSPSSSHASNYASRASNKPQRGPLPSPSPSNANASASCEASFKESPFGYIQYISVPVVRTIGLPDLNNALYHGQNAVIRIVDGGQQSVGDRRSPAPQVETRSQPRQGIRRRFRSVREQPAYASIPNQYPPKPQVQGDRNQSMNTPERSFQAPYEQNNQQRSRIVVSSTARSPRRMPLGNGASTNVAVEQSKGSGNVPPRPLKRKVGHAHAPTARPAKLDSATAGLNLTVVNSAASNKASLRNADTTAVNKDGSNGAGPINADSNIARSNDPGFVNSESRNNGLSHGRSHSAGPSSAYDHNGRNYPDMNLPESSDARSEPSCPINRSSELGAARRRRLRRWSRLAVSPQVSPLNFPAFSLLRINAILDSLNLQIEPWFNLMDERLGAHFLSCSSPFRSLMQAICVSAGLFSYSSPIISRAKCFRLIDAIGGSNVLSFMILHCCRVNNVTPVYFNRGLPRIDETLRMDPRKLIFSRLHLQFYEVLNNAARFYQAINQMPFTVGGREITLEELEREFFYPLVTLSSNGTDEDQDPSGENDRQDI